MNSHHSIILISLLTSTLSICHSQQTIALQNFEPSGSNYNYTNTNGSLQTGNSSSSDRPASSTFYVSSNTGFRVTNQTATLNFNNITGLNAYHDKKITLHLAAFSINSSSNGMDATDKVTIAVSLNGGSSFSNELTVKGNSNAYWHYTTGTGIATTSYDGNNTATEFGPAGGGNRTTDGYSTMTLNLPDSCTQLKLKITINDDSNNEAWLIDDVILMGCLPPSFTACPSNSTINTDADQCKTILSYMATATGNPSPTLSYVFSGATTASGSGTGSPGTFNLGITTVTITASSSCGSNAICEFIVKVEDHQIPIINCPSNQSRTSDSPCYYQVTGGEFDPVFVDDNCSVLMNSFTLSGATNENGMNTLEAVKLNEGLTNVTWTSTDASGNSGSCSFNVTVTLVVVSCPPDSTVCINGGLITLQGASPSGGVYSGPGVSGDVFDPMVAGVGVHTITYTYTYPSDCSKDCSFQITVVPAAIHNMQSDLYYCSLQQAIDAVETSEGDELQISPGVYFESCVEVTKGITITPLDSGIQIPCLTMSAAGNFLILGDDILINELTLTNGKIRTNGHKLICGKINGGNATSYVITD